MSSDCSGPRDDLAEQCVELRLLRPWAAVVERLQARELRLLGRREQFMDCGDLRVAEAVDRGNKL